MITIQCRDDTIRAERKRAGGPRCKCSRSLCVSKPPQRSGCTGWEDRDVGRPDGECRQDVAGSLRCNASKRMRGPQDANSACGGRRSGVWPPSTSTSYQYYHQAFSTDLGRSFSMPTPMIGAGCVRPRLFLLRPGGLLMSGGRDCVDDTVSPATVCHRAAV